VDPRLGGDAGLKNMVRTAHAHGIRVIMDLMLGDVHSDHEYVKAHPDWFIQGCVCGTNNCDWTAHRLDCVFASYLPRVDWTNPAVSQQWSDDAVYWADTYDLDGYRIDAVKHLQDAAIMNVGTRLKDELEKSGTRFFLTGETAMGWSDCGLACNQDQYDTISRYIGKDKLDGQFDFVLYHSVPYRVFDYDQKGLVHADYWAQASTWEYPQGSIMSPYIGSQDTARSVTLASYRGQDGAHDIGIPGNQWDNVALPPPDSEPYARHRTALSWLLGLPGAPMVYYGDEYGEWGGADPNNRVMWRGDQLLSADETATLALTRKLGQARRDLVAMRRGDYRHVYATETVLLFARQTTAGDVALVAVSRDPGAQSFTASLPVTLPLADGTTLHDKLGGPDVQVLGGTVSLTLPPRGSAILAP
jgi:neopullulanase